MMIVMAAGAAWMAASLQAAPAADVDLFCRGRGDRLIQTTTKVRNADGSMTDRSDSRRAPFDGGIRVKVSGGTGQALLPDAMLADDDLRGWHEIRKMTVSPGRIDGKIYFDWMYSPVMVLDRGTNTLRVTGSMSNFSGTCARYDARTAATRVAPSRPVPAPGAYPASGDPRAAARAMAAQSDARSSARNVALKADLAIRLFNAGTRPIVELVMFRDDGAPSKNWLRPGETLAPRTFRTMNFAEGRKCRFTTRVTFADTSRVVRPIDYCGKDILYASERDAWAE